MKKTRALALAIAAFVMLCSCATVDRLGPVPVGDSGLTVEWIGDISTKERTLALTENATIKAYSAHSSDKNADIVIHFYDFPENTEEETGLTPWQFAIMMQADGTYSEFPASYERGSFEYDGMNAKSMASMAFSRNGGDGFNFDRAEIAIAGIYGTPASGNPVFIRSDIFEFNGDVVYLSIVYSRADGMRAANAIEKDFLSRYLGPEVMSLGLWDDYPF